MYPAKKLTYPIQKNSWEDETILSPFAWDMWFSFPWRGFVSSYPLSRPYELQGTQCQGCHSQGYWLLLGACGLGTREGFCWKFSTESFLWEGNPREVSPKKGGGMWSPHTRWAQDPVINLVKSPYFRPLTGAPCHSTYDWIQDPPCPWFPKIWRLNVKMDSMQLSNGKWWQLEGWGWKNLLPLQNWYMIMEKRHLKMYFPLRMVDFF